MLRLLVLRHAKAAPHDAKHDRERPLVERGRTDAALIGKAMREKNYVPQLVLCSPAARTRETWDEVEAQIGAKPEVAFEESLYDASEETILDIVRGADTNWREVLYVGHNPGLERFARAVIRKPADREERRRCEAMAREFPTAALAVIDFEEMDWRDVAPATGALSDVLIPAEFKTR